MVEGKQREEEKLKENTAPGNTTLWLASSNDVLIPHFFYHLHNFHHLLRSHHTQNESRD